MPIATFIVNYPQYLPTQIENFARTKMLRRLELHNCWPCHTRSYGRALLIIAGKEMLLLAPHYFLLWQILMHLGLHSAGFKAILLKLGPRNASQVKTHICFSSKNTYCFCTPFGLASSTFFFSINGLTC